MNKLTLRMMYYQLSDWEGWEYAQQTGKYTTDKNIYQRMEARPTHSQRVSSSDWEGWEYAQQTAKYTTDKNIYQRMEARPTHSQRVSSSNPANKKSFTL